MGTASPEPAVPIPWFHQAWDRSLQMEFDRQFLELAIPQHRHYEK
jgi:hypothetical protein